MAEGMRAYPGPLPQGKIQVSMYTGAKNSVKTMNLSAKGIVLIHSTKDGQRTTRAVHTKSKLEGEGRSDQEAFDALQAELLQHDITL